MQCNPDGQPNKYTFRRWEHKSLLDQHVRYLSGNATGFLKLPIQNETIRYQDTGMYICRVSNGVADIGGKYLSEERAYVISTGINVRNK